MWKLGQKLQSALQTSQSMMNLQDLHSDKENRPENLLQELSIMHKLSVIMQLWLQTTESMLMT